MILSTIVKLLLATPGVNVNQRDAYGVAPLHKAVSFGHVGVVQHLLADHRLERDQVVGTPTVPRSFEVKARGSFDIRPASIDAPLLLRQLAEHHSGTSGSAGCDCVYLVANSGAGKSTTINYLAGVRFELLSEEYQVNGRQRFMKVLSMQQALSSCARN